MGSEDRLSRTHVARRVPHTRGRQHIGPKVRTNLPEWAAAQCDVLAGSEWGGRTRSAVVRDLVVLGLLTLKARGVKVEGFDPGQAVRDAIGRGEPTATALDG